MHSMTIGTTVYGYTYDANGNLTGETTTRHFGWSHADELKTFATQTAGAEPSTHAQYLYDSAGRRVKKLVRRQGGAVEVTHYLDGLFEHHRWNGGANNHVHVMDDRQRIALVRIGAAHPDDGGPVTAYHLGNQLGSSTAVVDGAGVLTNREEFTPCGETSFGSYTRKRYRFTGQERDEKNGLSLHGARYYAPWLARWTSVDPVGLKGGMNLYAYCACEPLALVDRDGRNFTVVVDFDKNTTVLGSVFVVRTAMEADQLRPIVDEFNAFNAPDPKKPAFQYHGMTVRFDVRISLEPGKAGEGRPQPSPYLRNEYYSQAWGPYVPKYVDSKPDQRGSFNYIGGVTTGARRIMMSNHQQWGNLGNVPDFLRHEKLHTWGLDDPGGKYWVAGGPMDYGVIMSSIGAHDPNGSNNVKLRRQEVSTIMKLLEEYDVGMTNPRSPKYIAGTPYVNFVNNLMPAGAPWAHSFDEVRADYVRRLNEPLINSLPAAPPPIRELPSLQPAPTP